MTSQVTIIIGFHSHSCCHQSPYVTGSALCGRTVASHPPGRVGQRGLERTKRGLPSIVLPFSKVPVRHKTSPGSAVSVCPRIHPPAGFAQWLITVVWQVHFAALYPVLGARCEAGVRRGVLAPPAGSRGGGRGWAPGVTRLHPHERGRLLGSASLPAGRCSAPGGGRCSVSTPEGTAGEERTRRSPAWGSRGRRGAARGRARSCRGDAHRTAARRPPRLMPGFCSPNQAVPPPELRGTGHRSDPNS